MALGALALAGASAAIAAHLTGRALIVGPTTPHPRGSLVTVSPVSGGAVPAFDLASDPVFPDRLVGYAIERHVTGGVGSERLAESIDGGKTWHLVRGGFPFEDGYSQVQFTDLRRGYVFGPAGLGVTRDGGRTWQEAPSLGGMLQRVVPIDDNVWATFTKCSGPPLPGTRCAIGLAISHDGGLRWSSPAAPTPLVQSEGDGGDVLARVTTDEAYVVTYGLAPGDLAVTTDDGSSWHSLPDPCRAWRTADLAALANRQLWLICGGAPVMSGSASSKAVFRSADGGSHWVLESSTGFGPGTGPGRAPVGHLWFAGQVSQLATISPTRAWLGVSGLGVIVTTDSGRDWSLARGLNDAGHDPGVGVTFNDGTHGWAIEFHEAVWKTVDGVHWRLVNGR